MKISELKKAAMTRLRRYGNRPYKLAFFTFAIFMAAQLLVQAISFAVSGYEGGEGLSGMGRASLLQTGESLLATVVQVLAPLWMLGFTAAVLSFMDWKDPEDKVLLTGLRRMWPFCKYYMILTIAGFFLTMALILPLSFLIAVTPWVDDLVVAMDGFSQGMETLPQGVNIAGVLILVFVILAVVLVVIGYFSYRLRFVNYMILSGWIGVIHAMLTSFYMTRGDVWTMFKLDLSYWWYYLAEAALAAVYILGTALGIHLGMSYSAAFWVSFLVYALASMGLNALVQPRITAAQVLIYRTATGRD